MSDSSYSQTKTLQLQNLFWSILDQYKNVTKSEYERQLIAVGSFWLANYLNNKYPAATSYNGDTSSLIKEALIGHEEVEDLVGSNINYAMVQLGHIPVQLILQLARNLTSINYDFKDILTVLSGLSLDKYKQQSLYGYYTGSTQLADIISCLIEVPENAYILDPCAGYGNTMASLDLSKAQTLELCDISKGMSIMSYIIWQTHAYSSKVYIRNLNSIMNPKQWTNRVDLYVCEPPFGSIVRDMQDTYTVLSPTKDYTELFVWLAIESMSYRGKSFIIVPDSLLFSSNKYSIELRQRLLDEDLVEAIISLPSGLLYPFASIKTNLLILSKGKPHDLQGKIKFFDAPIIPSKNPKGVSVDISTLKRIYHSSEQIVGNNLFSQDIYSRLTDINKTHEKRDSEYSLASEPEVTYNKSSQNFSIIPVAQVKEQNSNLLPLRYLGITRVEISNVVRDDDKLLSFKTILKNIPLKRLNSSNQEIQDLLAKTAVSDFKTILPKSISDNPFDSIEYFNSEDLTNSQNKQLLSKPAIIVSTIGTNPKAAFFNEDKPVLVSPSIEAYELDADVVLPEYFLLEFREGYVQDQLKMFLIGVTLQRIRRQDFLSVKIRVPSIEKQREYIEKAKQDILIVKNEELKLLKERFQTEDKGFDVLANFKHDFTGDLEKLSSGFLLLKRFLQKKSISGIPLSLNENLLENSQDAQYKLEAWLAKYERSIKNVISRLEDEVENMKFDKEIFKPEEFELSRLVKELLDKHRPFSNYTVEVIKSVGQKEEIRVAVDKRMMSSVIDNLITNAIKHGFKEPGHKYRILFELDVTTEDGKKFALIRYSNDGEPFPKGFTFQNFLQRGRRAGQSRGQGIGGDRINRIIAKHNGKFRQSTNFGSWASSMELGTLEGQDNRLIVFEILLPLEN